MAIIDQKGRLFGKVNLLDLVVVLAVVAVASRFGYKAIAGKQAVPEGEDKTVEVTLKFAGVAQVTADTVVKGMEILDSKTNNPLGTVVETRTQPTTTMFVTDDGRLQVQSDRFDHYVVVRGPGRETKSTVTLNGFEMKIGRMNFVKSKLWAGSGITWKIDLNPPSR